jgi:preprotein translocase subunit SecD
MRNKKIRGLIILVVLLVTAYYFLPLVVSNLPSFWTSKRLKLGLDLQGGSQIQLEVDFTDLELSEKGKEDAVKTALQIIRNRIDQFGVSEPTLQRVVPGLKILSEKQLFWSLNCWQIPNRSRKPMKNWINTWQRILRSMNTWKNFLMWIQRKMH